MTTPSSTSPDGGGEGAGSGTDGGQGGGRAVSGGNLKPPHKEQLPDSGFGWELRFPHLDDMERTMRELPSMDDVEVDLGETREDL
jgi:hypothetical protein